MEFGYCMTYNSIQLRLLNMELVHTLDVTIELILGTTLLFIFGFQKMCPYLMSSCVGH